jgi:hypothetical protein
MIVIILHSIILESSGMNRLAKNRKIGKSPNFIIFGSKKTTESKRDSQSRLRSVMPQEGEF